MRPEARTNRNTHIAFDEYISYSVEQTGFKDHRKGHAVFTIAGKTAFRNRYVS